MYFMYVYVYKSFKSSEALFKIGVSWTERFGKRFFISDLTYLC